MTRTQDHHQRSASNTPASTACRNADQAPEAYGITEYLQWLSAATEAEIADLLVKRPAIPRPVDIELLTSVEQALKRSLKDDDQSRRAARSAIWGVIGGTVRDGRQPG